jgi:hypothetical protein
MDKQIKETESVAATNNVGSGSIAALGIGKDGEPPGKPKKLRPKKLRQLFPMLKRKGQ